MCVFGEGGKEGIVMHGDLHAPGTVSSRILREETEKQLQNLKILRINLFDKKEQKCEITFLCGCTPVKPLIDDFS